jgi:hypothetical protein
MSALSTYVNPFTDFGFKRLFDFAQDELLATAEEVFEPDYLHEVALKDQHNRLFYRKLKYLFIEMPRFNKQENELTTRFEKWIYFLKNLEDFSEIPAILNEPIFQEAFEVARVANFDQKELGEYQESYKNYNDLNNVIDSAVDKKVKEIVLSLLQHTNLSVAEIAKTTGLAHSTILTIQQNNS